MFNALILIDNYNHLEYLISNHINHNKFILADVNHDPEKLSLVNDTPDLPVKIFKHFNDFLTNRKEVSTQYNTIFISVDSFLISFKKKLS